MHNLINIKSEVFAMIDFKNVPEKYLPDFKGGEGAFTPKMITDELNKIMLGKLDEGCSIGLHTHDTSSEIIFFISGQGKVIHNGVEEPVAPGLCHYCKMGSEHSLINTGSEPLMFYAVVPEHKM